MMDHRQNPCPTCRPTNLQMTTNAPSCSISRPKPSRKELFEQINLYSFAVNEANLFLDTHPFDENALAYFQKYRELRVEAVKEYAKYYAPLAIDYATSEKTPWSWANEPWPWEGVEC